MNVQDRRTRSATAVRRGTWATVALTAVLAPTACGPDSGRPGERAGPGTMHRDSAGVAIADAVSPLWGEGDGWTVADPPLLEIGVATGDPDYQLADVTGAARLASGDIVVAVQGSMELRWFREDGAFVRRAGGAGEGPGEFGRLGFVDVLPGDSVVAFDDRLQRVHVFGPDGALSRTLRIERPRPETRPYIAVGLTTGGLLVRFMDYNVEAESGIVRWPGEVLALVSLEDGSSQAIADVPGREADVTFREGGGYVHGAYLFAKGPVFAVFEGRFALAGDEEYAIRIAGFDGSSPVSLRRDVPVQPATGAHLDATVAAVVATVFPEGGDHSPEDVARLEEVWRRGPMAETLPVLRTMHYDDAGNLWVEPFYLLGADIPPYQVFAPDGTWLGEVALPAGHERGWVAELAPRLELGADYVLGVWKDDLDVQRVRMYRLEKSDGA